VTHGSATGVFIEDEEITSNLGTDDELNTRANYLLVVDGPYTDSSSSTLERYVCADTFLKTVDAETISGTLEELLLNSYLSNLKQSRYLVTLTIMAKLAETGIEAYPPMFRNYTFALLTRDSIAAYLIPTQMTIDYVSSQISLTLLEYVKDLGND
jgi:hypothetical protein